MILAKAADRRRYERGLVDLRQEAERALGEERNTAELRDQFIAVLGHDLRNPLTGVMGVADYLQREPLSEKGVRMVRLMKAGAQRMAGLIDNVLDFARGRLGGGIPVELDAHASVERTLLQVVDELRVSYPEREVVAELHVTGSVPLDHRRIAQLLSNLLGNRIEAFEPLDRQPLVDLEDLLLNIKWRPSLPACAALPQSPPPSSEEQALHPIGEHGDSFVLGLWTIL